MAYYYRGKRYNKRPKPPPLKTKVKRLANRVWTSMHGVQVNGGHRPDEHYVEQAMREVNDKLSEGGGEKKS